MPSDLAVMPSVEPVAGKSRRHYRLESRAALAAVLAVTLLESAPGASMIGFVSP